MRKAERKDMAVNLLRKIKEYKIKYVIKDNYVHFDCKNPKTNDIVYDALQCRDELYELLTKESKELPEDVKNHPQLKSKEV